MLYYIIVFVLGFLLPFAGISQLFKMRDIEPWKAFVPIYNLYIWNQIIGRKDWNMILLFIPIVNIFVIAAMASDLNKTFGRFSFLDSILAIALPFIWFPYMGFSLKDKLNYIGPASQLRREFKKNYKAAAKAKDEKEMRRLQKEYPIPAKGIVREWADSILFAVFAAHFIRLFLIEAYTIPTPSMEGSLLVGDFLFVSKAHYGSRMPMTPLSFPLLHNVMPITGAECYVEWPKFGYNRAPALQKVHRFDPVVFNYPEGDTVIKGVPYQNDYHNQIKNTQPEARAQKRAELKQRYKNQIVTRPVDKRDHYIKRCVGLPGDTIEVIANRLFVNGEKPPTIEGVQYDFHFIPKDGKSIDYNYIDDNFKVSNPHPQNDVNYPFRNMSVETKEAIEKDPVMAPLIEDIREELAPKGGYDGGIFPYQHRKFPWNNHHYGPIWIPKKGETVQLTMNNINLYQRIIDVYEDNDLMINKGQILINGVPTNEYTFKMNYYWMMGDNRDNSADSRSWGFVPEDHVVGKPLFVWFSVGNKGVRWNRLFMGASGK
jgi:signal peptidase I